MHLGLNLSATAMGFHLAIAGLEILPTLQFQGIRGCMCIGRLHGGGSERGIVHLLASHGIPKPALTAPPRHNFREEELGARLGQTLKKSRIPDDVLGWLQTALLADRDRTDRGKGSRLKAQVRGLDQAYLDKLDDKVSDDSWLCKTGEWCNEKQQRSLSNPGSEGGRIGRVLEELGS
jgi:hypothetical protein